MKTTMKPSTQNNVLAAVMSVVATLVVLGGPVTLAEHYAQNGASVQVGSSALASQVVQSEREHS